MLNQSNRPAGSYGRGVASAFAKEKITAVKPGEGGKGMQREGLANNNFVSVVGKIVSDYTFSHEVFGEGFYRFSMEVSRLSDAADLLPVTISERIMDRERFTVGSIVHVTGQVRSYNSFIESENRNRLVLTIFARDYTEPDEKVLRNPNEVTLNGFICKPPVYRTTPFGREIADLLIAVNRSYNKSDYIPCITWGRNARFGSKLVVGDSIKVVGRMQSRGYQKKTDAGDVIDKIAYEVSVAKIELASADKEEAVALEQPLSAGAENLENV